MISFWKLLNSALMKVVAFAGGFALGQVYYYYLLKQIPFPGSLGRTLSLVLSIILGIGNAVSTQLRCISLLNFPMYCGKPGRGVLKAVILTYIVTGPIMNMGLNAKEVVRVFACSTQLSYNLSRERYGLVLAPVRNAALGLGNEVDQVKNAFRTIENIIGPLQQEIEDAEETERIRLENNLIDDFFRHKRRLEDIDMKLQSTVNTRGDSEPLYQKKLQYRCEDQLSRASAVCIQEFSKVYTICCKLMPKSAEHLISSPLKQKHMCDLISDLRQNRSETKDICEAPTQPGLGRGFEALKCVKKEFVDNLNSIHLQYKIIYEKELLDIQDAKETAASVQHAFEEKIIVMHHVLTVMNICLALLFLRIFNAARIYHDLYLTDIDYDNVYVTDYFKRIDARRKKSKSCHTLLPLKKMERNKYIDVYSTSFMESQRSNLVMQILKVLLEVVTATTFLMLDRLFFEALEVVRQHTQMEVMQRGTRDFDIQVEGTGILATMLRKFLDGLNTPGATRRVTNAACLPHPRQMPYVYFLKIYGGYSWIVLLLFANPYTLRVNRLICSYFHPQREKQRIIHLYNDILKQRMKMPKTLRSHYDGDKENDDPELPKVYRRAVQTARAHYLSGDVLSLHALRTKFPTLLGWLRVLPAARVRCLICGVSEPRRRAQSATSALCNIWHSCVNASCPFVYCAECWREVGARCLACEPSLANLSDNDSLSDDEPLKY